MKITNPRAQQSLPSEKRIQNQDILSSGRDGGDEMLSLLVQCSCVEEKQ
jgi:hypothetical protein